jgi:THO complex subunit 3
MPIPLQIGKSLEFNAFDLQATKLFSDSKIKEYRGHHEKVHTVAWNCDGRRLASGSVDKTARIWTPHRGVS